MFDDNGVMLPETYDEEGNRTGPDCHGCGECADFEEVEDK
jgi:hypothetical protein